MSKKFALVFAISSLAASVLAETATLTGMVTKVRDGDTIEVAGTPIRLNGVSAPELDEALGVQSKQFMTELVMGKQVRCELTGEKSYDREIGVCYLDGEDIGAKVIVQGLALDCPRFSSGRYAQYEQKRATRQIRLPGYCRKR